jgi:hypothetical protein
MLQKFLVHTSIWTYPSASMPTPKTHTTQHNTHAHTCLFVGKAQVPSVVCHRQIMGPWGFQPVSLLPLLFYILVLCALVSVSPCTNLPVLNVRFMTILRNG